MRAARSTRTLGLTVIQAVVLACALASEGGYTDDTQTSRKEIEPVTVTVKKVRFQGDPHEAHRRWLVKQLSHRRNDEKRFLRTQREKWAELQINNYRYTLTTEGAWSYRSSVVVTVHEGKVTSAQYLTIPYQQAMTTPEIAAMKVPDSERHTIPELFALVDQLLEPKDNVPTVSYDPTFGYPLSIAYDQWDVSDDGFAMYVFGLEIIK